MKLRDFRIGWRLLIQEPGYSSVVVLGLALGFAACLLLLGYVRYAFNFDAQVLDREHVYVANERLNMPEQPDKWLDQVSMAIGDAVSRSGVAATPTRVHHMRASMRVNQTAQDIELTVVDPSFQQLLGLKSIEGDLPAALTRPDALALTVETAQRLFGDIHVIGKTVQISGIPFQIAAVVDNPPAATSLTYGALAGFNSAAWPDEDRQRKLNNWADFGGKVYVKLGGSASPLELGKILQDAANHSPTRNMFPPEMLRQLGQKELFEVRLQRLDEAYFADDVVGDNARHGDRRVIFGLAAVALLILLLAATNYVNLATVRTLRRQREIGIRKVLGASVKRITGQFLAESILVSWLATGLGLLLAWLLLPIFSDLVNRNLGDMFTPATVCASILLGLLIGVGAGAYPAWVARQVRATQSLAGRGDSETAGGLWLRRVLTVLQFATAMGLTGLTLAITWQVRHAINIDPGFDPSGLIVFDLPDSGPRSESLRDALARRPGVAGVARATGAVGRDRENFYAIVQRSGAPVTTSLEFKGVSNNFFDVYGVRPIAGRLFSDKIDPPQQAEVVVINAAAARVLGFSTPEQAVGQLLNPPRKGSNFARLSGQADHEAPLRIIGVAADIRYQSVRDQSPPFLYVISPQGLVLTARASGNIDAAQNAIAPLWQHYFPNDVLQMNSAQSFFALNYADDMRVAKLLAASAFLAIAIAAFGIYVLSAYSVQRRAREIVLRKLHGANRRAIARLVGREFIVLIVLGAAVGLPIAAVATERYLAGFVERAPIGGWALAAAVVVAASVALVATLRHTLVAMRMSPSLALRA